MTLVATLYPAPRRMVDEPLKYHDRFKYSPITARPEFTWPDGRRLAVYIGFNVEHFAFGEGLGAELAPSAQPDVLNYNWR